MRLKMKSVVVVLTLLLTVGTAAGVATISGTVKNSQNIPLCAMVLANGVFTFSCDGDGAFGLSTVYEDAAGNITLFVFCDGFSPYQTVLSQSVSNLDIEMTTDTAGLSPIVTVAVIENSESEPGWFHLAGMVENEFGTPLCAMVLANGQYGFTCAPMGAFDLTVPPDDNGRITVFGFCSNLMPYKEIIDLTALPTGKVPDTGQTTSYTDIFGEDSDYLINPPSYTKLDAEGNPLPDGANQWAMVKDNITALTWENKTDDGGIHDKDTDYTWISAQTTFIPQLNSDRFGGYSDWRLPTVSELSTLMNFEKPNSYIQLDYFPNTMSTWYWSSTPYAGNSYGAMLIDFRNGYDVCGNKYFGHYYVRAVRSEPSGKPDGSDRMRDNADGTVADTKTGLMWQQMEPGAMNFDTALTYCETLRLAGYENWRLPNYKELLSIVDYSKYSPAIDTGAFPDAIASYYLSSTTNATNPTMIWCMNFHDGYGQNGLKYDSYRVRAVRGGQ